MFERLTSDAFLLDRRDRRRRLLTPGPGPGVVLSNSIHDTPFTTLLQHQSLLPSCAYQSSITHLFYTAYHPHSQVSPPPSSITNQTSHLAPQPSIISHQPPLNISTTIIHQPERRSKEQCYILPMHLFTIQSYPFLIAINHCLTAPTYL